MNGISLWECREPKERATGSIPNVLNLHGEFRTRAFQRTQLQDMGNGNPLNGIPLWESRVPKERATGSIPDVRRLHGKLRTRSFQRTQCQDTGSKQIIRFGALLEYRTSITPSRTSFDPIPIQYRTRLSGVSDRFRPVSDPCTSRSDPSRTSFGQSRTSLSLVSDRLQNHPKNGGKPLVKQ